jgi:hypothetical protein
MQTAILWDRQLCCSGPKRCWARVRAYSCLRFELREEPLLPFMRFGMQTSEVNERCRFTCSAEPRGFCYFQTFGLSSATCVPSSSLFLRLSLLPLLNSGSLLPSGRIAVRTNERGAAPANLFCLRRRSQLLWGLANFVIGLVPSCALLCARELICSFA